MGSKKNKYSSGHASRGKFAVKKQPRKFALKKQPRKGGERPKSGSAVGGCRIVNMDQLQKFVAQISSHSHSCQNGSISRPVSAIGRVWHLSSAPPVSAVAYRLHSPPRPR